MTGKQTASLLLACAGILLCAGCDGQQAETAPDFATVSLVTTENASASAVSAADERMEAGGLLIEGDDASYTGTFNAVGCLFDYMELADCSGLSWRPRVGNVSGK